MSILKRLICIVLACTLLFATACTEKDDTSHKIELRKKSADEVVELALKQLLSNYFDDVQYFGEFGATALSDKMFYNAIFKDMEYNIIKTSKSADGLYTVEVDITNKVLKDLPTVAELQKMEEYAEATVFELQTALIEAIDEIEEFETKRAHAELIDGAEGLNIVNKAEFYEIVSGGYLK